MRIPRTILTALGAMLAIAAPALAQRVSLEAASQQAYLNEPTRLVLRIEDAEDFAEPVIPQVDGIEIRRLPGQQSSMSVQIINGRTTQRRTVEINLEATPRRTGTVEIPPISVEVGSRTLATKAIPLTVVVSETGDLMIVRVSSEPAKMFVGERGELNLEIAVRSYRDASLGITLDEGQLWSLLDPQSEFGVFGPALQKMGMENRRPRGESHLLGDTEYIVYTITKPFDPIAAGPPALGDIRIRMQYPTRIRRGSDGFFGERLSLAGARPISAGPGGVDVAVVDPPEAGRPASWNGAVGDFEITASAKPTEVSVGDPITVTLRIGDRSGRAGLEGLRAPTLAEQPAFAAAFRVPGDAASGVVEGRSKVFTQTIRALSDSVREIPPVEFAFFEPTSGTYRTVRSAPISVTVKPSAVARITQDLPPAAAAANPEFTRVEGGLLANASPVECATRDAVGLPLMVATAAMPALAAGAGLAARRLGGLRGDPRTRVRRAARAIAEAAIASDPRPESIEAALLAFVAARCGVDARGIARKDAADLLAARGVDDSSRAAFEQVLLECERARYLGGTVDPAQARAAITSLERATEPDGATARASTAGGPR